MLFWRWIHSPCILKMAKKKTQHMDNDPQQRVSLKESRQWLKDHNIDTTPIKNRVHLTLALARQKKSPARKEENSNN